MRAELWNNIGVYVAAFDMPPFKMAPTIVNWDGHVYQRIAEEAVHTSMCAQANRYVKRGSESCACDGGAWAYRESGEARNEAFNLLPMFEIEAGRNKPMTKFEAAPTKRRD